MRKFLAIGSLCLALSACASAGTKVDPTAIQQFQKGTTTYADVVAAVGEPTTVVTGSDGNKIAIYGYAQTSVRPATFVPFIGAVVGGADTKANSVIFRFDGNDKLIDYSSSSTKIGSDLGSVPQ